MTIRGFGPKQGVRGFTLIEILVTLVMSLLLIGGVVVVFVASQQAVSEAQGLARMQENVRFASDYLVRDIRNAGFADEASLGLDVAADLAARPLLFKNDIDVASDQITVRYAGRGDCTTPFVAQDELPRVIENTYYVGVLANGRRALMCRGGGDPEVLVSGVEELEVRGVCADGSLACACPLDCVGVMVTLVFDGGSRGQPDRSIQLKATFRNRVLEAVFP